MVKKYSRNKATHLGSLIKNNRERLEMSQSDLSYGLGYKNGQFISNIERGTCSIPPKKLQAIADTLDIDKILLKEAIVLDYEIYLSKF